LIGALLTVLKGAAAWERGRNDVQQHFPATTTSSDAFDAAVIPCNISKDILRADITAWIGERLPGSAKSGSDERLSEV